MSPRVGPNICSIHEVGDAEGEHFIVMEYVEGQTLEEKLASGRPELKVALQIAAEIAEALEEARARGIVHRGFLARFAAGAELTEVQRVPTIFSYLQRVIDDCRTPGRFVLTGSQQFLLMRGVSQSLAGRVAVVTLPPFSLAELTEVPRFDPAGSTPPGPAGCCRRSRSNGSCGRACFPRCTRPARTPRIGWRRTTAPMSSVTSASNGQTGGDDSRPERRPSR